MMSSLKKSSQDELRRRVGDGITEELCGPLTIVARPRRTVPQGSKDLFIVAVSVDIVSAQGLLDAEWREYRSVRFGSHRVRALNYHRHRDDEDNGT
jgi:hypothetical protein